MDYGFENLVIKGGGNTIYGVFGALEVLEEKGILKNIKSMAGSSAGSLIVGLLAIGYKPKELSEIAQSLDIREFLDGSYGYAGAMYRLYNNCGLYSGNYLYEYYGKLLKDRTGDPDITFKEVYDVYGVDLVITSSCVNKRETHYYRYLSNPNMPIRGAISISTRLPFLFKPVRWKGDWLNDGGLTNNYPIWIFDKPDYNSKIGKVVRDKSISLNKKTLGITILNDDHEETPHLFHGNDQINGNLDYLVAIIATVMTQMSRVDIDEEFWPQSISVRCSGGIAQTANFSISKEDRAKMIRSGRKDSLRFLQNRRRNTRLEEIYRLADLLDTND